MLSSFCSDSFRGVYPSMERDRLSFLGTLAKPLGGFIIWAKGFFHGMIVKNS